MGQVDKEGDEVSPGELERTIVGFQVVVLLSPASKEGSSIVDLMTMHSRDVAQPLPHSCNPDFEFSRWRDDIMCLMKLQSKYLRPCMLGHVLVSTPRSCIGYLIESSKLRVKERRDSHTMRSSRWGCLVEGECLMRMGWWCRKWLSKWLLILRLWGLSREQLNVGSG